MILSFHPCFSADEQLILGDRPINRQELRLIQKAKAILLPQAVSEDLYGVCSRSGARVFPNYAIRFRYPGKLGQTRLFKHFAFPHPKTLVWKTVGEFKRAFSDLKSPPFGLPFLIKDNNSHEAEGVYFVHDKMSLSKALNHLAREEGSGLEGFISQAYIPSDGNVLRVVIIGEKLITYWKRPNKPGEVITTISRGARVDHQWRPDLQKTGQQQVRSFSKKTGINLAAIDLIFQHPELVPEPLFLEVNYYFGRRGLGGAESYYRLLHEAIREWLWGVGMNPESVELL